MPADNAPTLPPAPGPPPKPYARSLSKALSDTDGQSALIRASERAQGRIRRSFDIPAIPPRSASVAPSSPALDALPVPLSAVDSMTLDSSGRRIPHRRHRYRTPSVAPTNFSSVPDSVEGPELRRPRSALFPITASPLTHLSDLSDHGSEGSDGSSPSWEHTPVPPEGLGLPQPPSIGRARSASVLSYQSSRRSVPAPTPLPHPSVLAARASVPATPAPGSPPFLYPRAASPSSVPIFRPIPEFKQTDDRLYTFKNDKGEDAHYFHSREELDAHHNFIGRGINSLYHTQDRLWDALQVNLDMTRHVCQETRTPVIFFPIFSLWTLSFFSISYYISPQRTA